MILSLRKTHRYNVESSSRRTINLSLESLPDDSQDLIERFSFNAELKEATLKLNGMHKGTIPALTVPIAFDRYQDFDRSCIENFQSELDKYSELGQLEKVDILGVLVDDANKSLILESIKEYHRNILLQNIKEAKEQQAEEKRKHHHYEYENLEQEPEQEQEQEQPEWEKSFYDVYGRKVPEQESLKFNTNKNNSKQGLIEEGTELLNSKYRFLTLEGGKEILYYDKAKGVYSYGGEILIEKELEEIFNFNIKSADITEIKGHIMRLTYVKKEEFDADLDIHNLKNGLYNVRTGELAPHTPDYYSLNQKPFSYNPEAKSQYFEKFLSEVLYPEDIETALDIIAYSFVKYNPHEIYFILIGVGSNGKSVYTGLITNLHGTKNISNVPLKALANDHFALADLDGKDVNIDTEMTSNSIKDLSVLKKLTGIQPIRVQRKYQHAYDTVLHAKLIFNANQLPVSEDNTDAHYRREIILSFPNQFEGEKEDPDLLKKLTSEEELSGIFNLVKPALERLVKTQRVKINQNTIAERKQKAQLIREPIKSFLKDAISPKSELNDYELVDDLYDAYIRFCKYHRLPMQGKTNFNTEVEHSTATQAVKNRKLFPDGSKKQIWKHIKLRRWLPIDPNETLTPEDADLDDDIPES